MGSRHRRWRFQGDLVTFYYVGRWQFWHKLWWLEIFHRHILRGSKLIKTHLRLGWMMLYYFYYHNFNTSRPRQNGRHFADDIFTCIFLNENVWILIKMSLKFIPKGPINSIPALVLIMAWCRPGDKPLSEPMMVRLKTHMCITRPQWVNHCYNCDCWSFIPGQLI